MTTDEYLAINRATWDERAPAHARSRAYAVDRFVTDPSYLSAVVRFDRPLLGEVAGLDGIHLQCHIGTDTISLGRLGARMTGLDLSPASLAEGRALAERTGAEVDWVESDVYGAPAALAGRTFDLVYTGIGALNWLPDVRRWAGVVDELLRPGGAVFLREGHPMLYAVDEQHDGLQVAYPYLEVPEPLDVDEPGTYVETDVEFTHNRTLEWNHGLGETVTALLDRGLILTSLVEHLSMPWKGLPGRMT
ncbi:MAG: class I SAM-dependent methyltransferase, partial [Phycicoccus sp.]